MVWTELIMIDMVLIMMILMSTMIIMTTVLLTMMIMFMIVSPRLLSVPFLFCPSRNLTAKLSVSTRTSKLSCIMWFHRKQTTEKYEPESELY